MCHSLSLSTLKSLHCRAAITAALESNQISTLNLLTDIYVVFILILKLSREELSAQLRRLIALFMCCLHPALSSEWSSDAKRCFATYTSLPVAFTEKSMEKVYPLNPRPCLPPVHYIMS